MNLNDVVFYLMFSVIEVSLLVLVYLFIRIQGHISNIEKYIDSLPSNGDEGAPSNSVRRGELRDRT